MTNSISCILKDLRFFSHLFSEMNFLKGERENAAHDFSVKLLLALPFLVGLIQQQVSSFIVDLIMSGVLTTTLLNRLQR